MFFFYSLILVLFSLQIVLTYQTRFLFRYEDAAINVIPVYWFTQREVFAVSTNFGWYALLHAIYSLFGFSINTVQIFRQVIQLFSLLSIGILLVRYLGYKKSFVPMLTIGLSPTFTYFVTSSAPYGIELQLLPIILLILDSLNFNKIRLSFLMESLLWFLVMFGLLTYATFNLFVPVIGILYWLRLRQYKHNNSYNFYIKHIPASALAFFTPLIAGLLYYKHPQSLFYNPNIPELGGLFRPSSAFVLGDWVFLGNLKGIFNDLFKGGFSYYYQLQNGEFTHLFPILSLILCLLFSLKLLKNPIVRICFFIIIANFLITSVSYDLAHLPGIRRFTPALASFYVLFAIVWHYIVNLKFKISNLKFLAIGILLLLPAHHLLVLPDNFQHLSDKSLFANDRRFELAETPQSFLKGQLDILTKQDLYLYCPKAQPDDGINILSICPYQNLFATLKTACLYNKLPCHDIFGFDPYSEKYLPLTFDFFQYGDYPHMY